MSLTPAFRNGAREGFRDFLPLSVGVIPWAMVTGIAMVSTGFTPFQAMGMNLIVFAGSAQLGTLPLIGTGAPLWLIVTTALVLNLRFVIFSAAIAGAFRGCSLTMRWFCGHLLSDGVFAACMKRILLSNDRHWQLGYYIGPSLWTWALWQGSTLVGVLAAASIPKSWSLEFMASIAMLIILAPMARLRPMLVAAVTGAAGAVALRGMPLRLGLIAAIVLGIVAGFVAEHWQKKRLPAQGDE